MERRADVEKRSPRGTQGHDRRTTSEMSLALWLRTGRAQKSLSLDDVARITKIQPRILEQLEAGKLDNLPAEVFVRGFVRNFAKCVGLDEDEALRRLAACKPGVPSAKAVAVIDAMADLAPNTRSKNPHVLLDAPAPLEISPASSIDQPIDVEVDLVISLPVEAAPPVMEIVEIVEPVVIAPPPNIDLTADALPIADAPKKKRAPRKRKAAAGTPSEPLPVVPQDVAGTPSEPLPTNTKRRNRKPRGSVPPPVETHVDAPDVIAPVTDVAITVESVEATVESTAESSVIAEPITEAEAEARAIADANEAFIAASLAQIAAAEAGASTNIIDTQSAAASFDWQADDSSTTRFDRTDDIEIDLDGPTWTPKMPVVNSTSTPWRRPAHAVVPSLVAVIDDADPDGAERALEDRRVKESRRTFLPPILLDREGDRSARQGGLTLAVIILLIAATLTLSYLMRRPSASGDGVTQVEERGDRGRVEVGLVVGVAEVARATSEIRLVDSTTVA